MPSGIYHRGENSKHANCRGDAETQFWKRVDKNGPIHPVHGKCWVWIGGKDPDGYGKFRTHRAAKFCYRLHYGEIASTLLVLHKCDNPSCVNPCHLFTGTPDDNMQDKVAKGRQSRVGSSRNPPKGERNTKAKITDNQVRGIRNLRAEGFSVRYIVLTLDLPISSTSVHRILSGESWKHIQ